MNFGFGFNKERDRVFILSVLLSLFILIIFSAAQGHAQTSVVSATITDTNGQAYISGTYNIQYVPPTGTGSANPPIRKDTGAAITQRYSGSLDGSGAFSVAGITRTDFINPALGQWRFTICPLATSSCFTYTTPSGITTSTLDLTAPLSMASAPISVPASQSLFSLIPRAYQDAEISGNVEGSQYYNIDTKFLKWYDGTSWNYNIASNTVATLKKLNGIAFAGIYPGVDIGAQINAAVADIGCGVVFVSSASYNSATKITTPRCVDVVGAGTQGSVINYTGTGVAWVIGDGTLPGFTTANYGIENISLIGPGTGGSTIALYLGGDPSNTIAPSTYFANSVGLNKVQIEAFNTCIRWGNNAYLNQFVTSTIKGCETGNYIPAGISNSGENINYIGSTIANNVGANGSAFRLDAPNTDIHLFGSSVDYNSSPAIKGIIPDIEFHGSHLEELVGEFINSSAGTFRFFGGEMIGTCSSSCGTDPQFINLSGINGTELFIEGTRFFTGHPMTQAINWTATGTYAQINLRGIPCYNGNGDLPLLTNVFTPTRGTYVEDCETNAGAGLTTFGQPIAVPSIKLGTGTPIAAQTGTGGTAVMQNSPTLTGTTTVSTLTGTTLTDGFVNYSTAQIERPGAIIEMQFGATASSKVRWGGNGSHPVIIDANAGTLTLDNGAALKKFLTTSTTIDFAIQAANTCTDSSGITLTGAADGDIIKLGVPAALWVTNVNYYAYVSSADTVKVRLCNIATSASADPASGTFRIAIEKY